MGRIKGKCPVCGGTTKSVGSRGGKPFYSTYCGKHRKKSSRNKV